MGEGPIVRAGGCQRFSPGRRGALGGRSRGAARSRKAPVGLRPVLAMGRGGGRRPGEAFRVPCTSPLRPWPAPRPPAGGRTSRAARHAPPPVGHATGEGCPGNFPGHPSQGPPRLASPGLLAELGSGRRAPGARAPTQGPLIVGAPAAAAGYSLSKLESPPWRRTFSFEPLSAAWSCCPARNSAKAGFQLLSFTGLTKGH